MPGGEPIANRAASASVKTALGTVLAFVFGFIANNAAPFSFAAAGILAAATLVLGVIALRNTRNPGVVGRRNAIAAIIFGSVSSTAVAAVALTVYAVHLSYEHARAFFMRM